MGSFRKLDLPPISGVIQARPNNSPKLIRSLINAVRRLPGRLIAGCCLAAGALPFHVTAKLSLQRPGLFI
jgi:hypothetical protein